MTDAEASLDEFYAHQGRRGPRCNVAIVREKMTAKQIAAFNTALADPGLQHSAIARTVKSWGYFLPKQTVGRHRSGECTCE